MARLDLNGDVILGGDRVDVVVTLSRRDLLALLHTPASERATTQSDCWINGRKAPWPGVELHLRLAEEQLTAQTRQEGLVGIDQLAAWQHPDPATLKPVPRWLLSAHRWHPDAIGYELRLAYIDGGVSVAAEAHPGWVAFGLWIDYYGNLLLVSHDEFPRDYARNLLALLRDRYGELYEQATGRSIESAPLVQLLKARELRARSEQP